MCVGMRLGDNVCGCGAFMQGKLWLGFLYGEGFFVPSVYRR